MSRLFRRPRKSRRRGAVEQAIDALERIRRGSARTARAKSEGGAYSKAVGLGISALVALIIISLSVWLLRGRAREETTPGTPEPEGVAANKAVVRRIYEAFSQNNLDVLDDLIASDFTDHNPNPGQGPGLEGLKQFISSMHTVLYGLQNDVEDMVAEGDKIAARLRISGTHQGEFLGIAPTGKQVTFTGIDILRIAEGKVVEHWGNVDELGMLQQLGAIPESGEHPPRGFGA